MLGLIPVSSCITTYALTANQRVNCRLRNSGWSTQSCQLDSGSSVFGDWCRIGRPGSMPLQLRDGTPSCELLIVACNCVQRECDLDLKIQGPIAHTVHIIYKRHTLHINKNILSHMNLPVSIQGSAPQSLVLHSSDKHDFLSLQQVDWML